MFDNSDTDNNFRTDKIKTSANEHQQKIKELNKKRIEEETIFPKLLKTIRHFFPDFNEMEQNYINIKSLIVAIA